MHYPSSQFVALSFFLFHSSPHTQLSSQQATAHGQPQSSASLLHSCLLILGYHTANCHHQLSFFFLGSLVPHHLTAQHHSAATLGLVFNLGVVTPIVGFPKLLYLFLSPSLPLATFSVSTFLRLPSAAALIQLPAYLYTCPTSAVAAFCLPLPVTASASRLSFNSQLQQLLSSATAAPLAQLPQQQLPQPSSSTSRLFSVSLSWPRRAAYALLSAAVFNLLLCSPQLPSSLISFMHVSRPSLNSFWFSTSLAACCCLCPCSSFSRQSTQLISAATAFGFVFHELAWLTSPPLSVVLCDVDAFG